MDELASLDQSARENALERFRIIQPLLGQLEELFSTFRREHMRLRHWIPLITAVTCVGCQARLDSVGNSESLTPSRKAAVENSVRRFLSRVAHDVTQQGPSAWRKYFADSPSFFMAAEGRLVFPNSQAATKAIQDLARTIKHIDLRWGDDLRVDPLTPDLAIVASSYSEVRISTEGLQVTENGFFSGLAEFRNGRWQFRNAHWSVTAPPSQVP